MIRIQQIKLPLEHSNCDIKKKVAKCLKIREEHILDFQIVKQSIDARKKNSIFYVYTVDIRLEDEEMILNKYQNTQISKIKEEVYALIAEKYPDGKVAVDASALVISGSK